MPPSRWNSRSCSTRSIFAWALGLISATSSRNKHAARRQLDLTGFGLLGAGERAALVAEELRLEQLLGKRGAVQRHERPATSRGCAMDVAGYDLLPRSGFASDENRRVRLRDLRRLLQHVAPFRGLADDADLGLRFELLGEHLHTRFELFGARLYLGCLSLRPRRAARARSTARRDRRCGVRPAHRTARTLPAASTRRRARTPAHGPGAARRGTTR